MSIPALGLLLERLGVARVTAGAPHMECVLSTGTLDPHLTDDNARCTGAKVRGHREEAAELRLPRLRACP